MARNCPTTDELRAYASGDLSLAEHATVEGHVDACNACMETVAKLDESEETFLAKLRTAADDALPQHDPELQLLAARAKSLIGGAAQGIEQQPTIRQGTVLGNYVVGEPLGGGNMGFVYQAYHQRMKRDVALKFIQPRLVASKEARQRFQREIEAAAKLNHPNIVVAYDADEVGGDCFLVQEFVEGTDLRELVKQSGPVAIDKALDYAAQTARGMQYAHEQGIVHRDIKPSNLLLDRQGNIKVTDLGLARIQQLAGDAIDDEATRTGFVAGTPAFMSPEQHDNLRSADQRSDVYSLGATLFYLLTGKTVAQATNSSVRIGQQGAAAVRALRADCPGAVDELVQEMLARDAESRPQSMRAVLQAIEALPRMASTSHNRRDRNHTKLPRRMPLLLTAVAGIIATAILLIAEWEPERNANQDDSVARNNLVQNSGQAQSANVATPDIELVRIEPGEFRMGSLEDDEDAEPDEKPQHAVRITRPFLLGKYEVTIAQYAEVMRVDEEAFLAELTPSENGDQELGANLPIFGISWFDAIRFCNLLSERHGLKPFYSIEGSTVTVNRGSDGFRLPTEAEWEFACRAGSSTQWCFGDDPKLLDDYAWFAENSGGMPHPIGGKQPNDFGLCDMHGNVPEWCWDRFDPHYYAAAEAINPQGATQGESRVFRGGGASSRPLQTRSAQRNPLGGNYGFLNHIGLRVARSVQ